jgi:transcriptional regulator with XRE-family HTH domain
VATQLCAAHSEAEPCTVSGMTEELVDTLREAIQAAIRKGETYKGIGERAGVDPAAVWRFVKGERSIDIVIAAKLAKALGLELRPKRKRPKRKGSK